MIPKREFFGNSNFKNNVELKTCTCTHMQQFSLFSFYYSIAGMCIFVSVDVHVYMYGSPTWYCVSFMLTNDDYNRRAMISPFVHKYWEERWFISLVVHKILVKTQFDMAQRILNNSWK